MIYAVDLVYEWRKADYDGQVVDPVILVAATPEEAATAALAEGHARLANLATRGGWTARVRVGVVRCLGEGRA